MQGPRPGRGAGTEAVFPVDHDCQRPLIVVAGAIALVDNGVQKDTSVERWRRCFRQCLCDGTGPPHAGRPRQQARLGRQRPGRWHAHLAQARRVTGTRLGDIGQRAKRRAGQARKWEALASRHDSFTYQDGVQDRTRSAPTPTASAPQVAVDDLHVHQEQPRAQGARIAARSSASSGRVC
jgi:hypothetical protein